MASSAWRPAIYKSGQLTELPRPVTRCEFQDEWDHRASKVPLKDGIETTGISYNGIRVTVAGQCGLDAGTKTITEETMFAKLQDMRAKVNIDSDSQKYEFFVYHKVGGPYRKLKRCIPQGFGMSFGDDDFVIFTYTLEVLPQDPSINTTAPGV